MCLFPCRPCVFICNLRFIYLMPMDILKLFFHKTTNFKKLPDFILLIDSFKKTEPNDLIQLAKQYKIRKIFILSDKEGDNTILNTSNITKTCGYPDLIILCDNVQRFYLEDPLLLYKAEIWFSNQVFSRSVLYGALKHYSDCELRNGK